MKKRIIIVSISVLCILFMAFVVSACIRFKEPFVVEDNVIVDVTYTGRKMTNIEIPEEIEGIGDEAFGFCKELRSVSIPSSVTNIGERAFRGCDNLTRITVDKENKKYFSEGNCIIEKETGTLIAGCNNSVIPNSATSIADYAFSDCRNMTAINIPDSVVSVGKWAFSNCYKLESVVIPSSVQFISESMFYWCKNLKNVDIADGVIGIEESAFRQCSDLANIKIPDSVTSIGKYAFDSCHCMTNIEIPSSVTQIQGDPFNNCTSIVIRFQAKEIPEEWKSQFSYGSWFEGYNIPIVLDCKNNDVAIDGYVYTVAENGLQYALKDTQAKVVGHSYISGDITIAESIVYNDKSYQVTEIDRYAFSDAHDIKNVEFPNSISAIGNYAFHYSGLIDLDLPIGVEQIGDRAFSYCYDLKSVELPSGLTFIGERAFSDCVKLESITVKKGEVANYVVDGNCLIEKATNKLIAGCNGSVIPKYVKIIGDFAFDYCVNLYDIEIPDGVTEIGKSAFYHCSGLTEIVIPNSVTIIGQYAFRECNSDMKIYCKVKSQPSGWDSKWSDNCIVVWGVE
ncbi:MAG: leucine-rich repeat domain-containing protein [Clostridia bacterium]|nr:leucine-rich repeat domain-containing protein [Clostridia bacterium]